LKKVLSRTNCMRNIEELFWRGLTMQRLCNI
jgi:hypothetical protein